MEKLKFIQLFHGGHGQIKPPMCDRGCMSRAIGTWLKPDGYSLDLCGTHAKEIGAEVLEGAAYVPTNLCEPGYRWNGDKPEKIPDWKPVAARAKA